MSRLALATLLLAACGCAPHVEWRADSDAFYYSWPDGRILEYDLAKKSSREVTRIDVGENEKAFPGFDLRPDGKRLVVAESTSVGNDTKLVHTELRVVDLDGKVERTAMLEWQAHSDEQSEPNQVATFVEWSPTAKHVLVATESSVALWDAEAGTFRPHEGLRPMLPLYVGASPWRPDGVGVLALAQSNEPEEPVFVGVDGSVSKIDTGDAFEGASMDDNVPRGAWQDKTLVATIGPRKVTIDTAALIAKGVDVANEPIREYTLGKATLRFDTSDEKPKLQWMRGDRTLALGDSFGPAFTLAGGPIVVSPDGQRAVVVRKDDLVVVDETGIVATLKPGEQGEDAK